MNQNVFTPADDVAAIVGMFRKELVDPARPFTLLVSFRVHAGVDAQVRDYFAEAKIPTVRDEGCLAFELNERHSGGPGRYVVYERWSSLADLEVHLRTPHATRLRNAYNDLIDGMPEFTVLVPVC